ncbi:permease [Neobacillus massiliamazoniensis]|uniref:Permease n=1 Tax=Neobacillus massiliamazoniensis TaxID=1499688 RepID=A0A0U1P0E9_9BACI|nr:permease [Neobacillus massiliamazoniensis]CRK83592.1 permease [Neobacillus massiliamazoniensis]
MRNTAIQKGSSIGSNKHFFVIIALVIVLLLYLASTVGIGSLVTSPKLQVFKMMFISIIIEALPFILIGVLVSAILQVFVTDDMIQKFIPKNPILGIITASVLGIIFPICECGMVPAIRKLVKKGMPLYVATTFILVGPILNPIVFLSTITAFRNQPNVAYSRMGLAFVIALIVGLIVYKFVKSNQLRDELSPLNKQSHHHEHEHHPTSSEKPKNNKFIEVMGHTVSEFFDMGKYLLFGSILVALIQVFVSQSSLVALGKTGPLSNLVMMGLGFILSLCSTSDAFVAQSLQTIFSKSSLVGFMVFGPMVNLKGILMMLAVFKTKFVIMLCSLVFIFVFVGTLVLQLMI